MRRSLRPWLLARQVVGGSAGNGFRDCPAWLKNTRAGIDRAHRRRRLQQHLLVLLLGVGAEHDRSPGADPGPAAVEHDRPDRDAEVAAAAEAEIPDRSRVDAARR